VQIGANIAKYRAARGLSQSALADLIGVRQQTVATMEAGQRALKYREAATVCEALQISLEDLGDDPQRAAHRAAFDRRFRAAAGIRNDLDVVAGRLARVLLDLAELAGANRHAPPDMQVPASAADEAARLLGTDWGAALNNDITTELSGFLLPPAAADADTYLDALAAAAAAVTDWTPGTEPVRSFGEEDRHGATT
jgi:transcriptional regulator with XRE-family HTH domain